MTIDEAAQILSDRYLKAPAKGKVVQIHLFGVEFADRIRNFSMTELAVRAGLPRTYGVELNKAINLAEFVAPK